MENTNFMNKINECLNSSKKSILIMSSPPDINANYSSFVEFLNAEKKLSGTIINLRNPSMKEKESFVKKGLDISKISFIDAITVTADFLPDDNNIYYLLNPNDLDGIKLGLESISAKNIKTDFLIIDLLDVLIYYNSIEKIQQLIKYLKIKSLKHDYRIFIFTSKENKELFDKISPFFDEKVEVQ